IYEGPRPRRPGAAAPVAASAPVRGEVPREEPVRGSLSPDAKFGIVLSIVGALGLGIAIGVWATPMLRPANTFLPPEPAPSLALSVTRPSETPAPAAIEAAPSDPEAASENALAAEPVAAPVSAKAAARISPSPQRLKKTARNDAAPAPKDVGGCKPDGSRAEIAICADPSIAAADEDMQRAFQRALKAGAPARTLQAEQKEWLNVREDAARRSPGDLADAYAQRVAELNAIADDPPH
ncbi:MAG: hypothetical protein JWQ29_3110, partial [Phenylobacterium sp.]|nr:hypothetical protein [Phenylobacterium sp.]